MKWVQVLLTINTITTYLPLIQYLSRHARVQPSVVKKFINDAKDGISEAEWLELGKGLGFVKPT